MIVTISSNDASINWNATGTERIIQNVKNIIRTKMYEIPFHREQGISQDYTDASPQDMADFSMHVTDVINTYEPRAEVLDVSVEACDATGNYSITVKVEV